MSQLLNCGVDQRTLTLLVALIENGVNPEALANVVKELQRETRALKVCVIVQSCFRLRRNYRCSRAGRCKGDQMEGVTIIIDEKVDINMRRTLVFS